MEQQVVGPSRIVRDYLSDSTVWKDFLAQGGFVENDIVVADPFKAGTTWTQQIPQQILDNGREQDEGLSESSPWLDSSWGDHAGMLDALRTQRAAERRRVIKSHMPADAIPIAPEAKYIFIGRNGKDLGLSLHSYVKHFSKETMAAINQIHAEWSGSDVPLVIPDDAQAFFDRWLETHGYGCCDLFDVVKSWWRLRDEPNVLLLHYQQLKDDLAGQIERLAGFLGIDHKSLRLATIAEHCSFGYMSGQGQKMAPFGGGHMSDHKAFFDKGPKRDYRTELTVAQIDRFDRAALEELGPQCAHWLETGEGPLAR